MYSQRSFFEAVLGSSFGTPVFASGILTNGCVDLSVGSNGAPAMVDTAKLCSASFTNRSSPLKTLHGPVLPSTSVACLAVIRSAKVHEFFSSLLYLFPFQCGVEREVLSTLGNMRPLEYNAWNTQAMISRSTVPTSTKKLSPPAEVKRKSHSGA